MIGNRTRLLSGSINAATAMITTSAPMMMCTQSRISDTFLGLFLLACLYLIDHHS